MEIVAIDLGSNTLRLLRYDCSKKQKVAEYEKIVRTAESLNKRGVISITAVERIVSGLEEGRKELDFFTQKYFAVTTQALRIAKNAKEVLETIYKKTGIKFNVIDGEQEAKLTLLAVQERLTQLGISGNLLLIDIGGGSTEITFSINKKIYTKSFPLGIVTVANSANSIDEIELTVAQSMQNIEEFSLPYLSQNLHFIATAGTPTTVAAMKLGLTYKTYDANLINGTVLKYNELDFYLQKLLHMSKKEKEITVGVGRDDLIIAGVVIFKELYRIFNKQKAIIIDDGLREGVALTTCNGFID